LQPVVPRGASVCLLKPAGPTNPIEPILEPDLSKNRHNSELYSLSVPTLKKRSDFLRLRSGKRFATRTLVLQSKKSIQPLKGQEPRIGYTVTKKVGNAVVRNRIRRRLRAAAREVFAYKARKNHDYVVIGKHGALTAGYTSILKDFEQALDHVHGNKAKGSEKSKTDDAALNIPVKNQR